MKPREKMSKYHIKFKFCRKIFREAKNKIIDLHTYWLVESEHKVSTESESRKVTKGKNHKKHIKIKVFWKIFENYKKKLNGPEKLKMRGKFQPNQVTIMVHIHWASYVRDQRSFCILCQFKHLMHYSPYTRILACVSSDHWFHLGK